MTPQRRRELWINKVSSFFVENRTKFKPRKFSSNYNHAIDEEENSVVLKEILKELNDIIACLPYGEEGDVITTLVARLASFWWWCCSSSSLPTENAIKNNCDFYGTVGKQQQQQQEEEEQQQRQGYNISDTITTKGIIQVLHFLVQNQKELSWNVRFRLFVRIMTAAPPHYNGDRQTRKMMTPPRFSYRREANKRRRLDHNNCYYECHQQQQQQQRHSDIQNMTTQEKEQENEFNQAVTSLLDGIHSDLQLILYSSSSCSSTTLDTKNGTNNFHHDAAINKGGNVLKMTQSIESDTDTDHSDSHCNNHTKDHNCKVIIHSDEMLQHWFKVLSSSSSSTTTETTTTVTSMPSCVPYSTAPSSLTSSYLPINSTNETEVVVNFNSPSSFSSSSFLSLASSSSSLLLLKHENTDTTTTTTKTTRKRKRTTRISNKNQKPLQVSSIKVKSGLARMALLSDARHLVHTNSFIGNTNKPNGGGNNHYQPQHQHQQQCQNTKRFILNQENKSKLCNIIQSIDQLAIKMLMKSVSSTQSSMTEDNNGDEFGMDMYSGCNDNDNKGGKEEENGEDMLNETNKIKPQHYPTEKEGRNATTKEDNEVERRRKEGSKSATTTSSSSSSSSTFWSHLSFKSIPLYDGFATSEVYDISTRYASSPIDRYYIRKKICDIMMMTNTEHSEVNNVKSTNCNHHHGGSKNNRTNFYRDFISPPKSGNVTDERNHDDDDNNEDGKEYLSRLLYSLLTSSSSSSSPPSSSSSSSRHDDENDQSDCISSIPSTKNNDCKKKKEEVEDVLFQRGRALLVSYMVHCHVPGYRDVKHVLATSPVRSYLGLENQKPATMEDDEEGEGDGMDGENSTTACCLLIPTAMTNNDSSDNNGKGEKNTCINSRSSKNDHDCNDDDDDDDNDDVNETEHDYNVNAYDAPLLLPKSPLLSGKGSAKSNHWWPDDFIRQMNLSELGLEMCIRNFLCHGKTSKSSLSNVRTVDDTVQNTRRRMRHAGVAIFRGYEPVTYNNAECDEDNDKDLNMVPDVEGLVVDLFDLTLRYAAYSSFDESSLLLHQRTKEECGRRGVGSADTILRVLSKIAHWLPYDCIVRRYRFLLRCILDVNSNRYSQVSSIPSTDGVDWFRWCRQTLTLSSKMQVASKGRMILYATSFLAVLQNNQFGGQNMESNIGYHSRNSIAGSANLDHDMNVWADVFTVDICKDLLLPLSYSLCQLTSAMESESMMTLCREVVTKTILFCSLLDCLFVGCGDGLQYGQLKPNDSAVAGNRYTDNIKWCTNLGWSVYSFLEFSPWCPSFDDDDEVHSTEMIILRRKWFDATRRLNRIYHMMWGKHPEPRGPDLDAETTFTSCCCSQDGKNGDGSIYCINGDTRSHKSERAKDIRVPNDKAEESRDAPVNLRAPYIILMPHVHDCIESVIKFALFSPFAHRDALSWCRHLVNVVLNRCVQKDFVSRQCTGEGKELELALCWSRQLACNLSEGCKHLKSDKGKSTGKLYGATRRKRTNFTPMLLRLHECFMFKYFGEPHVLRNHGCFLQDSCPYCLSCDVTPRASKSELPTYSSVLVQLWEESSCNESETKFQGNNENLFESLREIVKCTPPLLLFCSRQSKERRQDKDEVAVAKKMLEKFGGNNMETAAHVLIGLGLYVEQQFCIGKNIDFCLKDMSRTILECKKSRINSSVSIENFGCSSISRVVKDFLKNARSLCMKHDAPKSGVLKWDSFIRFVERELRSRNAGHGAQWWLEVTAENTVTSSPGDAFDSSRAANETEKTDYIPRSLSGLIEEFDKDVAVIENYIDSGCFLTGKSLKNITKDERQRQLPQCRSEKSEMASQAVYVSERPVAPSIQNQPPNCARAERMVSASSVIQELWGSNLSCFSGRSKAKTSVSEMPIVSSSLEKGGFDCKTYQYPEHDIETSQTEGTHSSYVKNMNGVSKQSQSNEELDLDGHIDRYEEVLLMDI